MKQEQKLPRRVAKQVEKAVVREFRSSGVTRSEHIEDLNYFLFSNFSIEQILKNYSILQVELLRLKLT